MARDMEQWGGRVSKVLWGVTRIVGGTRFSWEEKLVAPLIATPNVDKAVEDKNDRQKSYATGYTCNSRLQKGINILFCKQIGQSPSRIMLVV